MLQHLWLLPVGFLVGAIGTLIGAGGGFLLVPILIFCYPADRDKPEIITSISLAVVFFNALSGSIAYARMRRIDYYSSAILAAATVPGAILGALTTKALPARLFNLIFGFALLGVAAFLFRNPRRRSTETRHRHGGHVHRTLIEADGTTHTYTYRASVGILLSLGVGFLSSLLGIGGGIIHVPAMVHLLDFPAHIATATSHCILAVTALAGTIVHIATGSFHHGWRRTVVLAVGVLVGAQVGAKLSSRLAGDRIIQCLAVALGLVAIRLLWMVTFTPT